MSISIDYFFNSDKNLEQLCKEIGEHLGLKLELAENVEDSASARFLGMQLDFYTCTLENDGDLNFEDFKYEIGLTTYWGSADFRDMQVTATAFIAKALYLRMGISDGILVYDVQKLLARYKEKLYSDDNKGLFDEVSNKFVEFPQHLIDLDELAWQ